MGRAWGWGLAALLSAAVLVAILLRQNEPVDSSEINKKERQADLAADAQSAGRTESTAVRSGPIGSARAISAAAQGPDPDFQKWLKDEAKAVNLPNVDGERKRQEIRKVVTGLTANQSRQLLHTARNPQAPSGEKILSTFLLVEGGLNTRQELLDLINDLLPETTPEPHSVDEINNVRDKSLRIMAVDGLFSQAEKDPSARASLASQISAIQDPYVRAYAQRKLAELDRTNQ